MVAPVDALVINNGFISTTVYMIILFTDFGIEGPYIGQVQAVLHQQASGVPVINLFSDLAPFDIQAAAYLLPAYISGFEPGSIFLCVVDPGVGSDRPAVVVRADGLWFVGPNEGLFAMLARRAEKIECWELTAPVDVSNSFHGRDVFAPAAAQLVREGGYTGKPIPADRLEQPDWPDELPQVVYVDRFGNLLTGVRASSVGKNAILEANGHVLKPARTFSSVASGEAFWYENANGLLEMAVSQGSAAEVLGMNTGDTFSMRAD
jgi:S-adenosylmethionine hydrolase